MINDFHFLRPAWFIALLPLLLVFIWLLKHQLSSRNWQSFCDPELLPFLFEQQSAPTPVKKPWLFLLAGLLTIIALAGPSWEKRPQPVFKQQSSLIIVLDLSRSMDAADIKPSRLGRAMLKIEDILNARREGQTALIVYANDAFTVTPLTEDVATISSQLKSLNTSIMPGQGSHPERAIAMAYQLFKQTAVSRGHIVLITDGISDSGLDAINRQQQNGYTLSVLGVGTAQGAPIPLPNGGFLKDSQGTIVIPRLQPELLQQLALSHRGVFRTLSANDSDIQSLLTPLATANSDDSKATEFNTDSWFEAGPWLLLLVIPMAALAFRRGLLLVLVALILPTPKPAYAFEWQQLWQNDNQQAAQLLQQNKPAEAAEKFTNSKWKASAAYKAGDFQQALELYQKMDIDDPDIRYNLANTQAQLGQFDKALENYNQLIETNPNHSDAKYNRDLIEKMKQQNQQQNSSQQQNNDQQNSNDQSQSDQSKENQSQNNESQNNPSQSDQSQNNQSQSADSKTDQNQQDSQSENKSQDNQNDSEQNDQPQADKTRSQPAEKDKQAEKNTAATESAPEDKLSAEQQQANEQWLRRIPDDPGGLLRRKFQYQTRQRATEQNGDEQW